MKFFPEQCVEEIIALVGGANGNIPVDINSRNAYDRTALHWAAGNNNVTGLRTLIQLGASVDAKVRKTWRRRLGRTHFCNTNLGICPGIHFLAQETMITRKLFLTFSSKKVEIENAKVVFLLQWVVIINESWYNQAYIFLIIELWSAISTLFDEQVKNK